MENIVRKGKFACINVSYECPLDFDQPRALSFCNGLQVVFLMKGYVQ